MKNITYLKLIIKKATVANFIKKHIKIEMSALLFSDILIYVLSVIEINLNKYNYPHANNLTPHL